MKTIPAIMLAGLMTASAMTPSFAQSASVSKNIVRFQMVVSAGAASCLPHASANVEIKPGGPVETMTVSVSGLPPKTDFDFFVIQVPKAPFGMSWYQGDIETDSRGNGHGTFIGRFSIETFVVAPGRLPHH
jgi:hypothetical protein